MKPNEYNLTHESIDENIAKLKDMPTKLPILMRDVIAALERLKERIENAKTRGH